MEAAGIEPSVEIAANDNQPCACENCQQCRAAYALHSECFSRHLLASFDADLQRVIDGWGSLSVSVRSAIEALVGG